MYIYILHEFLLWPMVRLLIFTRIRILSLSCEIYTEKLQGLQFVIVDVKSVENTFTNIGVTGYASESIFIEETTIKSSGR